MQFMHWQIIVHNNGLSIFEFTQLKDFLRPSRGKRNLNLAIVPGRLIGSHEHLNSKPSCLNIAIWRL